MAATPLSEDQEREAFEARLLRECHLSGQMSPAQSVAHFGQPCQTEADRQWHPWCKEKCHAAGETTGERT
jgi:hypothetical protein